MQKLLLLFVLIFGIMFSSCKNDQKGDTNGTSEENVEAKSSTTTKRKFTLIADSTKVNWIAYKTTAKVPVAGIFKEVSIENVLPGNNITESIDGLKFSIPINSLFTKDPARDVKIINSFFGTMHNTSEIKGFIVAKSMNNAYAMITMNGLTAKLPIRYRNSGNIITLRATMDLNNWKVKAAIEALNLICNEKHKGENGISKTWEDVAIEITSRLKID